MRRALFALFVVTACKPAVDFSTGRPYACDDSTQCEGGWVCGVEHVCLDPLDAGSNACLTNTDCFAGKRCNVDGRCIDTSNELLNTTNAQPGPVTVLAPLTLAQGVPSGLFAYGVEPRVGNPANDSFRAWTAIAANGGQVTLLSSRGDSYPLKTADGGQFAAVTQVAANAGFAWVMTDTNLFQIFTNVPETFGTTTPVHVNGGLDLGPDWDLRTSYFGNTDLVALARDGGGDYHLVRGTNAGPVHSGPFATRSELIGFESCFLAASPNTLSVQNLTDGGWATLVLPELVEDLCGDGGATPIRVRATTPGLLAVSQECAAADAVQLDAGTYGASNSRVFLYELSALFNGDDAGMPACVPLTSNGTVPRDTRVTKVLNGCGACQFTGETLIDFHPLVLNQQYAVETSCLSAGVVRTYQVTQALDDTCTRTRITDPSPQFSTSLQIPAATNPFTLARTGTHGQLYVGDNLSTARPLFLDRAAMGLYRLIAKDGGVDPVHAFATNLLAEMTPFGIEQMASLRDAPIVATVQGTQGQVLFSDGVLGTMHDVSTLVTFANVVASPDVFIAPYSARQISRSDGVQEHLVRSFDSLYVGHPTAATVGNFELNLALVPSAGTPISSVTLIAPEGADAGLLTGYALTATGLFKIDESAAEEWSAQAVATAPGNRLAVFSAEGSKSRLAYDDGIVYSLPGRVQIAGALPNGARASDYLQGCSETWALTDQGLFRLVPDADGTGHWANEPLDAGDDYNFGPSALTGGRLFAFESTLYVFNAYGGALTFVPQGGCLNAASP